MTQLRLSVNDTSHELEVAGHETLLSVLRDRLSLTGAKLSCGRGECGACTVLMMENGSRSRPVYSCLTLAAACENASITTIEGVSQRSVHVLQQAFIAHDAVQCGFCTPGQILAAAALLEETPSPTDAEIRSGLSGNLCRCGTYPKIVSAVHEAARRLASGE